MEWNDWMQSSSSSNGMECEWNQEWNANGMEWIRQGMVKLKSNGIEWEWTYTHTYTHTCEWNGKLREEWHMEWKGTGIEWMRMEWQTNRKNMNERSENGMNENNRMHIKWNGIEIEWMNRVRINNRNEKEWNGMKENGQTGAE